MSKTNKTALYDALGVPADATREQIRAAYRARAKQIHPDNQDTDNPHREWTGKDRGCDPPQAETK